MHSRRQLKRQTDQTTGEIQRHSRELIRTNRTLRLLKTIDALTLESHVSVKMVSEHITEAITQAANYPFVGLLTRTSGTREELVLSGWSGSDWLGRQNDPNLGLGRPLHIQLMHPWFAQIESSKLVPIENLSDVHLAEFLGCRPSDIKRIKAHVHFKSLYVIKLVARRRIVGLLVVGYNSLVAELSPSDTELLDEISDSIGVALDNKLLYEQNRNVIRQLKESNAKLVALDVAKDDFISMASHQLRTPLTSVKGYTSMVL
ncbi:MAG TPA: histidine kinase dimerization/phospho-acceptor domain-containing protein, partial [Candidatus Saccharimonadales bacterium]|nr:histidine kinase dimerization/phospho-acceptor domain-containing protein [Candidatus Saccharimonadales bacterium]